METISRSSDDDEELGKPDAGGSSHRGEKVDRRSSDPSTPRSRHSATEQRRRSKINDRLQILSELVPHSDQKRDKASFLLEVIEYISLLQEKVQKYEASYPGMNEENAWEKVYFRSIWKNAQNNIQGPTNDTGDAPQLNKNRLAAPGFTFCGRFDDSSIPLAPAITSDSQNPSESENLNPDVSHKAIENPPTATLPVPLQQTLYSPLGNEVIATQRQPRLVVNGDTFASESEPQVDCPVGDDILNEQEEITIDEDTISASNVYSHSVLTSLTQALQSSGVDFTQASISVQINLGKRAIRRPETTTISGAEDHGDISPGNGAIGHSGLRIDEEEYEQLHKKQRSNDCQDCAAAPRSHI